jgi:hypothetical protein
MNIYLASGNNLEVIHPAAARQAYIHQFKNMNMSLYNCNSNIYLNQICLQNNLILT